MRGFPLQLLLPLALLVTNGECNANNSEIEEMMTRLLASPYSPYFRPDSGGQPVTVNVSIHVGSVSSVNTQNMDFTVSIYLRRSWYDSRLIFNESTAKAVSIGYLADSVWKPDIYFVNEKSGSKHDVTMENNLLLLYPTGRLILSTKYTLVLSCLFGLQKFPLDSQLCHIEFGSYGYSTEDLLLQWTADSRLSLSESAEHLSEYDVFNVSYSDCTESYAQLGTFDCLRASLHMRRKFTFYLIQLYIPSIMVVILSWVSFWIDHRAIPARVSLGLLTVLTVTTQTSNNRADTPKVSYVKGIDVWLTGCLAFVFLALIEFAMVNMMHRQPKKVTAKNPKPSGRIELHIVHSPAVMATEQQPDNQQSDNHQSDNHQSDNQQSDNQQSDNQSDNHQSKHLRFRMLRSIFSRSGFPISEELDDAEFVDFVSKFVFPLGFLIFNALYWGIYLGTE